MSTSDLSRRVRDRILSLAVQGKEGHIGSSFSIVEILIAVFGEAGSEGVRERLPRFVLSKGHAALGLYALMRELTALSDVDLDGFAEAASRFGGHPTKTPEVGILVSTGSLGHGVPLCAGMAFAARQQGDPGQFICLAGDGEINEGSVWESLLLITKFGLDNLTLIVDDNSSSTRAIDLGDIAAKLSSFGLHVQQADGHNIEALRRALVAAQAARRPSAIVAKTIKGFGSAVTRNSFAWHHRVPTNEEVEKIRAGYDS